MKKLNYTLCVLAIASLNVLYATPIKTIETVQERPVSKTVVENQLNHLLTTSTTYQDFKLVKKRSLEELKSNLMHFLSKTDVDLQHAKASLLKQTRNFENSKSELLELKSKLNAIHQGEAQLDFLGITISKSTYHTFVWSLMGMLLVTMLLVMRKFKNANALAVHSKTQLSDLEEEFNTYKQNAIERELKIQRQLLNEINKQQKLIPDVS